MSTNIKIKPLGELKKLTSRQEGNARVMTAKYTTKVVNRIAEQALGMLKDKDGNPYDMSAAEIKACSIILDKTLPNLVSQKTEESDDLGSHSRTEMQSMLAAMLESNTALARMSGIQSAVNNALTVAEVRAFEGDIEDVEQDS